MGGWGLGSTPDAPSVPGFAHVLFQGGFAIVTPALISGSVVGRVKLSSYLLFIFFWSTFVVRDPFLFLRTCDKLVAIASPFPPPPPPQTLAPSHDSTTC